MYRMSSTNNTLADAAYQKPAIMLGMTDNMDDFIDWINQELKRRDWSQADLARRAGMTRGGINGLMNKQQKKPGLDAILGIARALEMSPCRVLKKAGLLPNVSDTEIRYEEFAHRFKHFDEGDWDKVMGLIDILVGNDGQKGGTVDDEETKNNPKTTPRNAY